MRRISFLFASILLFSCNNSRTCNVVFIDLNNQYCVESRGIDSEKENGRYIYYDFNMPDTFKQGGFYLNGFRNKTWQYNVNGNLKSVEWAYFKDENLNIETNTFFKGDSTKNGDGFTMLEYSTEYGPLSLTMSINGPLKDSSPEINYARITKEQLETNNYSVMDYKLKTVADDKRNVYVMDVLVQGRYDTAGRYFLRTAYAFINNTFIEFTVNWKNEKNVYAPVLFDGVLTNFYYKNVPTL